MPSILEVCGSFVMKSAHVIRPPDSIVHETSDTKLHSVSITTSDSFYFSGCSHYLFGVTKTID